MQVADDFYIFMNREVAERLFPEIFFIKKNPHFFTV